MEVMTQYKRGANYKLHCIEGPCKFSGYIMILVLSAHLSVMSGLNPTLIHRMTFPFHLVGSYPTGLYRVSEKIGLWSHVCVCANWRIFANILYQRHDARGHATFEYLSFLKQIIPTDFTNLFRQWHLDIRERLKFKIVEEIRV